jgi:hypothetical protein
LYVRPDTFRPPYYVNLKQKESWCVRPFARETCKS